MAESAWSGARLRELRESASITREELAKQSGVSTRAITQWERDEREPGWTNVLALAKALGVDCTAFTRPPAEREPAKPGRPPKVKVEAPPAEKKKRGRPEKGNG
jgi:transcriptional regulator with XRE-family HTH domain